MRMQIHQLVDACLFALSFWLAYELRSDPVIINFFGLRPVGEFKGFVWLYLVLMPAAPLILEAQGFYSRPLVGSRWTTLWQLFKGCVLTSLALILALFCFKMLIARWVVIWFGAISFILVFLKEEMLRLVWKSKLAQIQYHRRFILVGTAEETARMRMDLKNHQESNVEVVAELDLNQTPIDRLVQMLHEHSVNGVIVSAKHTYFEQVENVIQACELEGVEVWLVADFFKTQISRTSFDELFGRPLLVFRTTPEASWQSVVKQLMDFFGALVLLLLTSVLLARIIALLIKLDFAGPGLLPAAALRPQRRAVHASTNSAPW